MSKRGLITLVLLSSMGMVGQGALHTAGRTPLAPDSNRIGRFVLRAATVAEATVPGAASEPAERGGAGTSPGRKPSEGLVAGVPADWWDTVQEEILRSEYDVTWHGRTDLPDLPAAYHAPNRAHNLRTYFTERGIRIIPRIDPRIETMHPWELDLALTGFGYAGHILSAPAAELAARGGRIEYRRGDLVEWTVNDERGLEQGFVLQKPPSAGEPSRGDGEGAELVLELAVSGNLTPNLRGAGGREDAVEFTSAGGVRVLRYGGLPAFDATGSELPARFEIRDSDLAIVVDDSGAIYPITIDLLLSAPSWAAEGNQSYAHFGLSVGTAGDVNGDGYDDVIVSAPYHDGSATEEGRVFVYTGTAEGLSTTADWIADGGQAYAYFGWSVGTAGDVNGDGYADIIVGAPRQDNTETDEGRAYVYCGSAAGLSTTANWTAESNQAAALFGNSVGTAGDVNGDGYSDIIVGAKDYSGDEELEGRAYVYHGSGDGLSTTANWAVDPSDQEHAHFGFAVGTAGDVNGDGYADVIVGAYQYDGGEHSEGRAYLYTGTGSGLSRAPDWTAESDQVNACFGWSVGTAGDVNGDGYADVIVGAFYYDHGETDEGRAYVFHGSGSGLSGTADWTAEGNQDTVQFGRSVGTAGDVNGDGYADVIVGAPLFDGGQADEGRACVYHGSAAGLSDAPGWTAESDLANAKLGYSVATAGDVNGDGCADVIAGALDYSNGQTQEGSAYVYHGSAVGDCRLGASAKLAPAVASPGQTITYTIVARNNRVPDLTGAWLTDTLSPLATVVPGSLSASAGDFGAGGDVITWTGVLSVGAPVMLTFAVTTSAALSDSVVTNTAVITHPQLTRPHPVTATTALYRVNLHTSEKGATPSRVRPGEGLTYALTIRNTGIDPAIASLTDTLSPRLAYVPGSLLWDGGTAGVSGRTITWAGTLAPGAVAHVRYRALTDPKLPDGAVLTNTATVSDGSHPPFEIGAPPVLVSYHRKYLPVVGRNWTRCLEVIQNGGFESGRPGMSWTQDSEGRLELIQSDAARTGAWGALLGGYDLAEDGISQPVSIRSGGAAALSYYRFMSSAETSTLFEYDYLYIRVKDSEGNTLRTVQTLSNLSARGQWVKQSFDVSEFAGQTVRIEFAHRADSSNPTTFYVDDVSLWACGGSVSPP